MNVKLGGSMRYRDMGPASALRSTASGGAIEPRPATAHPHKGRVRSEIVRPCSVAGCDRAHAAKGLCLRHWQLAYRRKVA